MLAVSGVSELRACVEAWRGQGQRIVFVPTMGNLHVGHLALVERARALGERVVVSVFVNPTQFAPGEDYETYPRTLEADRQRLASAQVDLLFAPDVDSVYPEGARTDTAYAVPDVGQGLEETFRPGHFAGVMTVVRRLFELVSPDVAVFGEKDYQQLAVIRAMVRQLALPIEIVSVPTVREADGLALSSRNQYLTAQEREIAPLLQRTLREVADSVRAGQAACHDLEAAAVERLRAGGFSPDYVCIRDADTLQPLATGAAHGVVLAAASLGRARLIDNVAF
jgi:pantoate--beta-alanine ligase